MLVSVRDILGASYTFECADYMRSENVVKFFDDCGELMYIFSLRNIISICFNGGDD